MENSAAYIKSWRDTIAADKNIVVREAVQAQKAYLHMLNQGPERVESQDTDEPE